VVAPESSSTEQFGRFGDHSLFGGAGKELLNGNAGEAGQDRGDEDRK